MDAVIDGHDHHAIAQQFVNDMDGNPVLLTSSGSNFEYVGRLTIDTDGSVSSSLTNIAESGITADSNTQQFVEQVKTEVGSKGNFVIGHSDVDLTIYNAE